MDLTTLKQRRGNVKTSLTKALHFVTTLDRSAVTLQQLRNRRQMTEGYFTKFEEYQNQIEDLVTDQTELATQLAERDEIEARFLDIVSIIDQIIDETTPPPQQTSQPPPAQPSCSHSHQPSVRLPSLDLPSFQGTYDEWTSFKDLFKASIDANTSLSNAQKLQYLKTSTKGDAAILIRTLTICDANYDEAWKALEERYDNNREIVFSLLKRLFTQQAISKESSAHLQRLLDTTREVLRTLTLLKRPVEHWDDVMVYFLVDKMDPETKRQWAIKQTGTDLPKLSDLYTFIEQYIRGLEACQPMVKTNKGSMNSDRKFTASHFSSTDNPKCPICKNEHLVYKCLSFTNANMSERQELAKKHSLCFNCLRSDHKLRDCKSRSTCKTCNAKHHTLLHLKKPSSAQANGATPAATNGSQENTGTKTCGHGKVSAHESDNSLVLLATATAHVIDQDGTPQLLRLFLDTGSEGTFITESCVNSLGLKRRHCAISISGIGSTSAGTTSGEVDLEIYSSVTNQSITISALILPKVTKDIPSEVSEDKSWPHLQGLQLDDPDYYQPRFIDILLGAEYVPLIMLEGIKKGPPNSPIAQNTIFGWVLSGRVPTKQVRVHHTVCDVNSTLQKFWETEEMPTVKHFTPEEKAAEEYFSNNYYRQLDGRFNVALPFNQNLPKLGSSRDIAMSRLIQVERRLAKQPVFKDKYCKFMCDYEALHHMELIPDDECGETIGKTNYLPHHFVTKTADSESKFRVVFDGSAKSSTDISLNDCLLVGPTIQDDIYSLLLRFRVHCVVIKADIGKMYRQFCVNMESSNFQRILWRPTPSDPVKEYRLTTVTYGTASAPFLATRCLSQLAKDNEITFPVASRVLQEDTYVDDVISGAENEEKAITLYQDLQTIAGQAQLELLKWSTNNEKVLSTIPLDKREADVPLTFDESNSVKALGVQWHPKTDSFSFSVADPIHFGKVTKRILLSEISKVFDPLGFLSPVIISAKILLQDLWKAELTWDDQVPDDILGLWLKYSQELTQIQDINIPRCITIPSPVQMELHGFSDASQKAYGAVVYLRSKSADGSYHSMMVTAKTKVAPLKQDSLPRLELRGAVMVAQLLTAVKKATKLEVDMYAWTDSTIVLKWISSFPGRWQTFVGNRVSTIQGLIPPENWKHVSGAENPADCASRGITPEELRNHSLWWTGTSWLANEDLPVFHTVPLPPSINLEEKKKPLLTHQSSKNAAHTFLSNMYNSFKTLRCLQGVIAMLFRFARNCRLPKSETRQGKIKQDELNNSLQFWIKFIQQIEFKADYNQLKNLTRDDADPNKSYGLGSKSKLLSLNPFLDSQGVMRVGGRLQNSNIPDASKHQMILPKCHLVTLIVNHFHVLYLHAGFQLLWATLQRQFWIIRARDTIRHILRSCIVCRRVRAESSQQLMGNLPEARVTPTRAFLNVGVDYAGPFNLRVMMGRSNRLMKGYMATFVCMSTKAVHLEPVSELSTDAFLAALECFVSRRGLCQNIYSDCGTNFVGADKELKTLFKSSQHNDVVIDKLAKLGINWVFNPPAAPHQGGLWEAAVKSAKYHLKRVIGAESVTFEAFRTILCKVEACLNSRPLTPMSPNPDDFNVLTPGHFLIGQPLLSIPQHDYKEVKTNRLDKWQRVQQLTQHFWRRWSNEYLMTLQRRFKWTTKNRNLQIGDIVLVKEDNSPPMKWKTGRVVKVHPGSDDKVRVVTVRLYNIQSNKYYELLSPIVKLCPLLYNDEC